MSFHFQKFLSIATQSYRDDNQPKFRSGQQHLIRIFHSSMIPWIFLSQICNVSSSCTLTGPWLFILKQLAILFLFYVKTIIILGWLEQLTYISNTLSAIIVDLEHVQIFRACSAFFISIFIRKNKLNKV